MDPYLHPLHEGVLGEWRYSATLLICHHAQRGTLFIYFFLQKRKLQSQIHTFILRKSQVLWPPANVKSSGKRALLLSRQPLIQFICASCIDLSPPLPCPQDATKTDALPILTTTTDRLFSTQLGFHIAAKFLDQLGDYHFSRNNKTSSTADHYKSSSTTAR